MFPRQKSLVLILSCLAVASGCRTHQALKRSTVHQAETVMDIQQKQVLDNLAKFVHDPYAVPSFALATQGVSGVTDSGRADLGIGWVANGFDAIGLGVDGNRAVEGNWTMTPITDPRKLELMRCAYQRVLANCGVTESPCCPDCKKRFNKFYKGRSYGTKLTADGKTCYTCDDNSELKNLVSQPCDALCICQDCACEDVMVLANPPQDPTDNSAANSSSKSDSKAKDELIPTPDQEIICFKGECKDCPTPSSGIVTSECLYPSCCWFRKSCNKKDVPKRCQLVGRYCGTYVWVPCGPGRDQLAQLTLAILDFATNEDRELPTKEVVAYMKRNGCAATKKDAELVVTSVISADERSASVVSVDLSSQKNKDKLGKIQDKLRVLEEEKKACLAHCNHILEKHRQTEKDAGKNSDTQLEDIKSFGGLGIFFKSNALGNNNASSRVKAEMEKARKTHADIFKREQALEQKKQTWKQEQDNRIRALPPIRPLPQRRTPSPGAGLLILQQQLNTVR